MVTRPGEYGSHAFQMIVNLLQCL